MGAYLVRRFLLMLVTLFGMSMLIFVMLRLVPGNITDIIFDFGGLREPGGEEEDREASSASTSRSSTQYVTWIGGLARGDLGYAYVSEKPAIDEILPRIPVTAKLAVPGAGLLGAVRRAARRHQRGAAEHLRSTTCCA